MVEEHLTYHLFLIFAGAAVLATVALFARQAMIVAYIILGLLLGPAVFNLVPDPELIQQISDVGIIFLLFLLGLNLHPQKLITLFKSTLLTTLTACLVFGLVGGVFSLLLGLNAVDSLIVGIAMMFSSTIIGLKLLPTTILHHQHTGEIIISILLLQDIIAILADQSISLWNGTGMAISLSVHRLADDRFTGKNIARTSVIKTNRKVRYHSGIRFSRLHRLVPWICRAGTMAGTIFRNGCIYRRRCTGSQPYFNLHRGKLETTA